MVQPTGETNRTGRAAPVALTAGTLAVRLKGEREQRRAPGTFERVRTAFLRRPIALVSLVLLIVMVILAVGHRCSGATIRSPVC